MTAAKDGEQTMDTQEQGTNGKGHSPGIGERVDHIGSSAQEMWREARSAVVDIGGSLDIKGRTERHPYGTMLAALGVGYVLGGGLFTPLTARLVRLGLRLAAIPLVRQELRGIAASALDALQGKAQEAKDEKQS